MCNQGKLKIPCGKRSAGCSAYVSSGRFCRSFVGCFFSIEDSHPPTGLLLTGIRPLSSPRVPGNGLICKASTAKEPASNPESADPRVTIPVPSSCAEAVQQARSALRYMRDTTRADVAQQVALQLTSTDPIPADQPYSLSRPLPQPVPNTRCPPPHTKSPSKPLLSPTRGIMNGTELGFRIFWFMPSVRLAVTLSASSPCF